GAKNKPTIVILGQDPKSDQDSEKIHLGTPYGLHHKGSREVLKRTKLYFEMITTLLELGCRVYFTDIYKIWVCNPNRPYYGINLPDGDQEKFISVLKEELTVINPIALVTWGKVSANSVTAMKLDTQHLSFPHPSGAANGAWSKLINKSPTDENKLAYWNTVISESLSKRT
ncbi:MAG: uracil-DNA glycosylase family protein, partial [Cyanobacteria bacterium J06648_16]